MKHRFFLLNILLCLFSVTATSVAQTEKATEEEWNYEWFGVVQPSQQDGFWLKRGNGKSEVRDDGFLIATQAEEYLLYVITQQGSNGVWDGSVPQVIEFSARALRIEAPHNHAAHLSVSDGSRCAAVRISGEEFQDYRLEWADGSARLLVDGEERPELLSVIPVPPDDPFANSLNFGDESGSSGGESLWRYIRWKTFQP